MFKLGASRRKDLMLFKRVSGWSFLRNRCAERHREARGGVQNLSNQEDLLILFRVKGRSAHKLIRTEVVRV